MIYPVKWVRVDRFCQLTGDTPGAVKTRCKRGIWLEGVHFRVKGQRRYINLPKYDEWVESQNSCAA